MAANFPRSAPAQIVLFVLFWLIGEAIVRVLHLPFSGGLPGLALVLTLLGTRTLQLGSVKPGADWLLAHMLLFLVPAVLAVMEHPEFLGVLGVKILIVIVPSTAAVMAVTALVVELAHRRQVERDGAATELR